MAAPHAAQPQMEEMEEEHVEEAPALPPAAAPPPAKRTRRTPVPIYTPPKLPASRRAVQGMTKAEKDAYLAESVARKREESAEKARGVLAGLTRCEFDEVSAVLRSCRSSLQLIPR